MRDEDVTTMMTELRAFGVTCGDPLEGVRTLIERVRELESLIVEPASAGSGVPTVVRGETRWIHIDVSPVAPTEDVPDTPLEPATEEEHAEAAEAVDVEVSPDPER